MWLLLFRGEYAIGVFFSVDVADVGCEFEGSHVIYILNGRQVFHMYTS